MTFDNKYDDLAIRPGTRRFRFDFENEHDDSTTTTTKFVRRRQNPKYVTKYDDDETAEKTYLAEAG